MSDILLYVSQNKGNEELRYAVRTWEKNLKFDKLYAVGGPTPDWFKPDIMQLNPMKYTKMRQCYDNLIIALNDDRLSEDVILMMDDIFLLKPCGEWEINYNRGTLQAQLDRLGFANRKGDSYLDMVNRTKLELEKKMSNPLSFEEHLPFRCNRKKLLKILEDYGPERMQHLLYRSIYGNIYKSPTEFKLDLKLKGMQDQVPQNAMAFSTNGLSFRGNGGSYMKYHFQQPSRFERH